MRPTIALLCTLLLVSTSLSNKVWGSGGGKTPGAITKNVDGDTLWVQPNSSAHSDLEDWRVNVIKVRMINIDAPEEHLVTDEGVLDRGIMERMALQK